MYPCKLKILPDHIFNTRDPIVFGVNIESGTLRIGTPIIVPDKGVGLLLFHSLLVRVRVFEYNNERFVHEESLKDTL